MAFYTETLSSQTSLMTRVAAAWDTYKANAEKRAVYKQTLSELQNLTSRELMDLGIHRSHIKRIAYEAAYQG